MPFKRAHIAYCSNVHPGESLVDVQNNIAQFFSPIRVQRQLATMASGLWLSAKAAEHLTNSASALNEFQQTLNANGVLLTSLNGFPFGNFHQAVVKKNVYLPTWAEQARLHYSQQLAKILANCLPEQISIGAISTLPLAYANGWTRQQQQAAINNLLALSSFLAQLEKDSGKRIVICLEMEPDCVLQYTDELVDFFQNQLLPAAKNAKITEAQVLRYIGCCYDTCHQGVMNEDITASLTKITQAGLYIGKIQISNAVNAHLSSSDEIKTLTEFFQDKKFLHQTKLFNNNQFVTELADLSFAALVPLAQEQILDAKIHYHIPINQCEFPLSFLSSTQEAINQTLDFLAQHQDLQPYLEIETYTWLNFLAEQNQQQSLSEGIVAEFLWLENALRKRQLL